MIDSGRSVALDCYAIGRKIPEDDPVGPLFKTEILNKSIVLKQYEKVQVNSGESKMFDAAFLEQYGGGNKPVAPVNVNTVVYFPYDTDNVYDGGESIVFSAREFAQTLAERVSRGTPSDELVRKLDADSRALTLLDAIPSLDPFLLRCKAEQIGVEEKIHPGYFAVTRAEWEDIRKPIRGKIERLVRKALGVTEMENFETDADVSVEDTAVEQDHVTHFLDKIWHARNVEGIETFVQAMSIEPDDAPRVFFAWKAVCYFQHRFAQLIGPVNTMFQWVGHDGLCFPVDALQLSGSQRNRLTERRAALRTAMRDGYVSANKVLREYEHSYTQFVDGGRPRLFLEFLANAENSYLLLANHVSIMTHSVNFWRSFMTRYGAQIRNEQFMELLDGLTVLNDVALDS